MPHPFRRGGRGMFGASIAGIVNANVRSDQEARKRSMRVFGSVLALLFFMDIACAFAVICLECREQESSPSEHYSKGSGGDDVSQLFDGELKFQTCLKKTILEGIHFHATEGGLGDLFLMAVGRAAMTTLLLLCGMHYGQGVAKQSSSETSSGPSSGEDNASSTPSVDNDLTEPLLPTENGSEPQQLTATSGDTSDSPEPSRSCCSNGKACCRVSPPVAKNVVLVLLFVTTTIYQVYAGLKVSTWQPTSTESIIPLLCLTVLWINAEAYVFRALLAEMTRQDVLFLPPEVHSHPMYIQNGRALAVHWCDLCRTRIQDEQCYRCSLCDFDVCEKCAKRNDAATVGENVLRGDRGVRVETNLTTKSYVRRSIEFIRKDIVLVLLSFVLLGGSSLSRLLLPHFQGHIIDKVIPDENGDYDKSGFFRYIRIYLFLMVIQGAISTLYSAMLTLVSRRLKFTLRNALLEKIMSQDVAYFDGTQSGHLISRLTNDLDMMMAPIQSSLSSLLNNTLILGGGLVMCFIKSYRLSMLAFVTVGPISYLWQQYALWSKGLARQMLSFWAEGNGIAAQALTNIRTIKAFGCEDQVLRKYTDVNRQALRCGVKDAWGNGVTSALTGYLDLGTGVLILYFGGLLVYKGEMSVGELVTFQLFWNMMNNAYQNLQGLITVFTRSAAGAEKVFSLWDSEPDIDPKRGQDVSWDVQGHIKLENVDFHYQMRPDNKVLENFNLEIPAGKTLALVGRSGGGKSTIINLLLRFYDPKAGKLTLDGKDYESVKVHQLRRLFGVVTQETELFALTIEENIAYGLDKEDYTMEDVIEAAKKACAHEFIEEMKDGYQTRIGERGNRLSGGQRQRLAIARVFLRRPKIILLDEATSALDENSQDAVQQALSKLIAESNATVVLVAHRLSTVVNADSICVVDKGKLLEQGNHEELVAQDGIYASMVAKQLKKKADLLDQETEHKKKPDGNSKLAADSIDALMDEK